MSCTYLILLHMHEQANISTTRKRKLDVPEDLSTPCHTSLPASPLVHPFKQALANSMRQQVTATTLSTNHTSVQPQLWQPYCTALFSRVLSPSNRHSHMRHIVTTAELKGAENTLAANASTAGRYLRVFDAITEHDVGDDGNLVQQLMASASQVTALENYLDMRNGMNVNVMPMSCVRVCLVHVVLPHPLPLPATCHPQWSSSCIFFFIHSFIQSSKTRVIIEHSCTAIVVSSQCIISLQQPTRRSQHRYH